MPDENSPEANELEKAKRGAAKLHNANEAFDEAIRQGADPSEIPAAPPEPGSPA